MPLIRNESIAKIETQGGFVYKQTLRDVLRMKRHEWNQIIALMENFKIENGEDKNGETEYETFAELYKDFELKKKVPIHIAILVMDYSAPDLDYTFTR